MEEITFNPEPAERIHFTDSRVRQLAQARWRMETGRSHQEWLSDGPGEPGNPFVREARDWLRAAVACGLLPPTDGRGAAYPPELLAGAADAEVSSWVPGGEPG